jgi:LemA protein
MTQPSHKSRSGRVGLFVIVALVLILLAAGGCGVGRYNALVTADESVDGAFSEIDNQYKRRSDLIPQLVETIQGSANFEEDVLTEVTEARASVGRLQLPADLPSDPAAQAEYLKAQQTLGSAIGRLMMVAESYPDLKTTAGFRDMQAQIEGTETRIAVARRDYIDRVKEFNTTLRKFPTNVIGGMLGFEARPQLEAATVEEREVPKMEFGRDE